MAGLGRRSHYRKHVTDSVLHDLPEPGDDESIAVVMATRGSNQFDVRLPHSSSDQLAILPTKFRKLVWLKRNDFVIVQTSLEGEGAGGIDLQDDSSTGDQNSGDSEKNVDGATTSTTPAASEETGTIRCMVTHILYGEQVKHLRSKGLWPSDDNNFDRTEDLDHAAPSNTTTSNDGIVYEHGYDNDGSSDDDADLFVNTNRISRITLQASSSEDESDDD